MNIKSNKKSFTLVELLVVISVIAILAAIVVPQVVGVIQRARDTAIMGDMRGILTVAADMRARGLDLSTVHCDTGADSRIAAICSTIRANSPHPTQVRSFSGPRHFCIQAPLHNGNFWRVDHTGFVGNDLCGYVARWDMNENPAVHNTVIRNSTGTNHGTLFTNDGTTNKAVAGAIHFDGIDDGVGVSGLPKPHTTLTFELWLNIPPATFTSHPHFMGWSQPRLFSNPQPLADTNISLYYRVGTTSYWLGFPLLTHNTWQHIVIAMNASNGTVQLAKNGTLLPIATTITGTIGYTDQTIPFVFSIAGSWGGTRPQTIDEVRVYDRALTSEEIVASFRRDCRRLRPDLCP